MQKPFNIWFSSDLHGNQTQYKKLFLAAGEANANAILLGGDLAPKDAREDIIEHQKKFFLNFLFPFIKDLKKSRLTKGQPCFVGLILGNDDFATNDPLVGEYANECGFIVISNKITKLYDDFKVIGYDQVPLTPFLAKDREKLDLNDKQENIAESYFSIEGYKATANGFSPTHFDLTLRQDTIEKDLTKLFNQCETSKTILISHAPPYSTNLDIIESGAHVGSRALRNAIEQFSPLATLHGHIHETVNRSGQFTQKLNNTICMSAGNTHFGNNVAVVKFDLHKPNTAVREII